MRKQPKTITARIVVGSPSVTWIEVLEAQRLRGKFRAVRLAYAFAVLRRRNKKASLLAYDFYVQGLRKFCRAHGVAEPRLPRMVQAQLTKVRRGLAVLRKLRGEGQWR